MRVGVSLLVVVLAAGCGSSTSKPETPLKVSNFTVKSKLLGRSMYETLVTPTGGGDGPAVARLPARLRRHAERHAQPGVRRRATPARRPRAGRRAAGRGRRLVAR